VSPLNPLSVAPWHTPRTDASKYHDEIISLAFIHTKYGEPIVIMVFRCTIQKVLCLSPPRARQLKGLSKKDRKVVSLEDHQLHQRLGGGAPLLQRPSVRVSRWVTLRTPTAGDLSGQRRTAAAPPLPSTPPLRSRLRGLKRVEEGGPSLVECMVVVWWLYGGTKG
jgi:hypothetical protein